MIKANLDDMPTGIIRDHYAEFFRWSDGYIPVEEMGLICQTYSAAASFNFENLRTRALYKEWSIGFHSQIEAGKTNNKQFKLEKVTQEDFERGHNA